jgi:chromate transport protein ChrA
MTDVSRKVILSIFVLGISALCFWAGRTIPMSEQWPIYEGLRTTSGIVFGVTGAWLAIVYPNALKKVFGQSEKRTAVFGDLKEVDRLLEPMRWATIILMVVLIAGLLRPLPDHFSQLRDYRHLLRGISFAFLGAGTVVQTWTVLASVMHAEDTTSRLQAEEEKNSKMNDLMANQPQD